MKRKQTYSSYLHVDKFNNFEKRDCTKKSDKAGWKNLKIWRKLKISLKIKNIKEELKLKNFLKCRKIKTGGSFTAIEKGVATLIGSWLPSCCTSVNGGDRTNKSNKWSKVSGVKSLSFANVFQNSHTVLLVWIEREKLLKKTRQRSRFRGVH